MEYNILIGDSPINSHWPYLDLIIALDEKTVNLHRDRLKANGYILYYDPYNKVEAFKKALEWGGSIPIVILYKCDKPSFIDRFHHLKGAEPLVKRKWSPQNAKAFMDELF